MDNTGFWTPPNSSRPILNVGFEHFWDTDEVIWEHYFKTSHCFLWEKYDVRYNPEQADVIFYSLFQRNSSHRLPSNVPKILMVHEPFDIVQNSAYDQFKAVISFSKSSQPNNIRIPYWVYRVFDQYASHEFGSPAALSFDDFLNKNFIKARNPKLLDTRQRFCAFVQGKSVPWRDQVFDWLNTYKTVDCGGSLFFNLPDGAEKEMMARRLMGREANQQKFQFFYNRKFGICMENTMDMPGYTTEKLIDAYFAGCIPIYAGQFDQEDEFNVNALINVYDYGYKDAFVNQVIGHDNTKEWELDMRSQPLFTKFPEKFGLDAILDTYGKLFER